MKKRGYFFDFDGVLADSVEVKTEAFKTLYRDVDPGVISRIVCHHRNNGGMNRYEKFAVYEKEFLGRPFNEERCRELAEWFSKLVLAEVIAAPEIPGAVQFLRKISQRHSCFIVSATPEAEICYIIEKRGLKPFLTEVRGAPRSKTKNLADLLQMYKLDPHLCLYFGDAVSDYEAAQNCDVRFVGILPGPEAPLAIRYPDTEHYANFLELEANMISSKEL